jgi:1L-myo-inositol 1-phosphate cytidylyltransferase
MPASGAVVEAVILAAGNGSRLGLPGAAPKPLARVAGRTLLDRIVSSVSHAGVRVIHIVTGHGAADLQQALIAQSDLDIRWVHNHRYAEPNGLSLLAVEEHVTGPFALLMADHLFDPTTLMGLLAQTRDVDGVVVAADSKIDEIWDIEDATKLRMEGARVTAIGKSLSAFNAVDTGMFVCTPRIFRAMHESARTGDLSLSGGVAALAAAQAAHGWDIGGARWIDIDTPDALIEAEVMVRDGKVSDDE